MIITGNIITTKGPLNIKDLKVKDVILDIQHRQRIISAITPVPITSDMRLFSFEKNKGLVLSSDTNIYTLFGPEAPTEGPLTIKKFNDETIEDTCFAVDPSPYSYGYNITIAGAGSLFASNYCVNVAQRKED